MGRAPKLIFLALGLAIAVVVTPARAAQTPKYGATLKIQASTTAAVRVSLRHAATLQPSLQRPRATGGYVGLEITRAGDPNFTYYAVLWGNGQIVSGEVSKDGLSQGIGPVSGSRAPAEVQGAPVRLGGGSYLFTVLTHSWTTVTFLTSNPKNLTSLTARLPTAADEASAAFPGNDATYAYHSLSVRVPGKAHLVLVLANERWAGDSSLNYFTECLDLAARIVECADPFSVVSSVEPGADSGTHDDLHVSIYRGVAAGSHTVTFVSAKSGSVSGQQLLVLALP